MNRFSLQNVKDAEINRVLRQVQDGLNKLADAHTDSIPVAHSTSVSLGALNAKVADVASAVASVSEGTRSGTSYTHTQGYPATTWNVVHNLGYYPSVTVVDSGGTEVIGDVEYLTINTLDIHFTGAFSGHAFFS